MRRILLSFFLVSLYLSILPSNIFAQDITDGENSQIITIVNPVRRSLYSAELQDNLIAQYAEVSKRSLPATWLLNYDSILDSGVGTALLKMSKDQEFGIFLEITPKLAEKADVVYSKTDSWHRANAVFLSGYPQEDRRKMIDAVFEEFKERLGYYPTSVGAWWVDSYSLGYMQQKYGITANLTVADQHSTDGYQVWGQYWSVPYYPSKYHAGMPARSKENKLDIVTIQWASRDPLNGYGTGRSSYFSTQDYFINGLTIGYFEELVKLYALKNRNKFGHITIGLEGDLTPGAYRENFASQLEVTKRVQKENGVQVLTMKNFSRWYRDNFPKLSPAQVIESDDLLGKEMKSIWYQSPSFRINILYNYQSKETMINDLRVYTSDYQEPYYVSPNRQLNLHINIPSQIDSAGNPEEGWKISNEKLKELVGDNEKLVLKYEHNKSLVIDKDSITISGFAERIPKKLLDYDLFEINKSSGSIVLKPKQQWYFPQKGLLFTSLSQEATFFLKQKKVIFGILVSTLFICWIVFLISKINLKGKYKIMTILPILILVYLLIFDWYKKNSQLYYVSQEEVAALEKLKSMPGNRVVVYDRVCLQCSWHSEVMPAIFANKRSYVGKISQKDIIYNYSVFEAQDRQDARERLSSLNADYIYVAKIEEYAEKVPFSPGDLNLEQIYENANSQIWKIRKK